jgi:hypothetical protein
MSLARSIRLGLGAFVATALLLAAFPASLLI